MQTEQATEDADGADNLPRHSRCRRSGRGTNSSRGRSKPWQTQIEQITHLGTPDADVANKTQKTQKWTKHRYGESYKQQRQW